MPPSNPEIAAYVEEHIDAFHNARLARLQSIKLQDILKRKNPYLFKAKNIRTAETLVKSLFDAHLSSQEETIFGEFLEGLAIFIATQAFNGYKSGAVGIDLELTRDDIHYIVAIKSGPNWANSSQLARMRDNFTRVKRVLNTNRKSVNVVAVNGCCYGRDDNPDKGDHLKLCGQRFWEFVSGNPELYVAIIEPLGHRAREKNEEFDEGYAQVINNFTAEFSRDFAPEGIIDWSKIVRLTSASRTM